MILSVSPTYWADRIDTVTTVTKANTKSWTLVDRQIMRHPRCVLVTAMNSPWPRTRTRTRPRTLAATADFPARGTRLRCMGTASVWDRAAPVAGRMGSVGVAAARAGQWAVPGREPLVAHAVPGSVAHCAG